jgi:hypothetical protein
MALGRAEPFEPDNNEREEKFKMYLQLFLFILLLVIIDKFSFY